MTRADLTLTLAVGAGAAIGGVLRYWCSGVVARLIGETFPAGTLVVNILGSFLIGLLAALTGPDGRILMSSAHRQFHMVGVLGGFTTFSSFSLQTLTLLQDGEWLYAGANIVLSVLLCLVGVWGGYALGVVINR